MRGDITRLWNAIQARFALRPYAGEVLEISSIVFPTFDIETMTSRGPVARAGALNLSGAVGTFVAFAAVPAGQIWRLVAWDRDASTGTLAIAIEIDSFPFVLQAFTIGRSGSAAFPIIRLKGGDRVGALASANVADTAINVRFAYEIEHLRPGAGESV